MPLSLSNLMGIVSGASPVWHLNWTMGSIDQVPGDCSLR